MTKKFALIAVILFLFVDITNAQFFNKFSLFGGPMVGWHVPNVTDLNTEIKKLGYQFDFSKSGFLTLGGGGFIDVPLVAGLRIGAFGTGFSEDKQDEAWFPEIGPKAAKFSFHYAAISVEYAKKISKNFDYTFGGNVGVGKTKIELSKFMSPSWGGIVYSDNYTKSFSTTTYTFNPQIGIGYNVTKFMYLKLNAGYMFTIRGDWKLNDVLIVTNVPSGIKADGFNFNLGINFGLFTD